MSPPGLAVRRLAERLGRAAQDRPRGPYPRPRHRPSIDCMAMNETPDTRAGAPLSPREREVLERLAHGHTNAQMAAAPGISVHAVKSPVAAILPKLGAPTRPEAASLYLRSSLQPPRP